MNTLSFREMVDQQAGLGILSWSIFKGGQIFSFVIFLIAAFAETNRVPCVLPEAENEVVAVCHPEYSSIKFPAFFLPKYTTTITVTFLPPLHLHAPRHPPHPP